MGAGHFAHGMYAIQCQWYYHAFHSKKFFFLGGGAFNPFTQHNVHDRYMSFIQKVGQGILVWVCALFFTVYSCKQKQSEHFFL